MEKEELFEKWKKIEAREKKDNPYGGFVTDEGEFVEIKSGVKQLEVEELFEENEGKEDGGTNDIISLPEQ